MQEIKLQNGGCQIDWNSGAPSGSGRGNNQDLDVKRPI